MKSIEEKYQKLTQREHVLKRGGMYLGSTELTTKEMFVFDLESEKIVLKVVEYNPGLLKIFDEILTNALDHAVRNPESVDKIKVSINKESGLIEVWNNGPGIPVEMHKEHNMYLPEMLLGALLSSSNYDDNEARVGAGTFGIGGAAANIYSKKFTIETVYNTKKYVQTFTENMSEKTKPKITTVKSGDYTKISFIPDFERFGMKNGTTLETLQVLYKRVYDCMVCTKGVSIFLNDKKIKGKGLMDYIKYYENTSVLSYESTDTKYNWEYAVCLSDKHDHVSFVNGTNTVDGGKHVDYLMNGIVTKLKGEIERKKKLTNVKISNIKDSIMLFVNCTIPNPTFSSQSKETLTTQFKDFKTKIEISDKFIDKLYKSEITTRVVETSMAKEILDHKKQTDGKKKTKVIIPKLEDAIWAGGRRSNECTLILTEGDSASTFAKWGRTSLKDGIEKMGVFPLKGKVLSVRDATLAQLTKNDEINNIKQILGLQTGVRYTSTDNLRYGRVLILTDSDCDGSHIKGLLINMFHFWWKELLDLDFLSSMKTPIIKVTNGKKSIEFFSQHDYDNWVLSGKKGTVKYYKGLGTSTSTEAKDLFSRYDTLKVLYKKTENCDAKILLAFGKDKIKSKEKTSDADKRKEWLRNYDKNNVLNMTDKSDVSYSDFIEKELVHFSIYDNQRSIPNVCDGLKPSQRKILFTLLKRGNDEIKVAQLSGYVSAETAYHHGEVSLQQAIINMAQDFIGSNNINLLEPLGSFGSRYSGKDAASPRYIFTKLAPITRIIYNKLDLGLLPQQVEEGKEIEPEYFLPIIPMALVNGVIGIGTGFSTSIPMYNPKDLIKIIKDKIQEKQVLVELVPWYKSFKGNIKKESEHNYTCEGLIKKIGDKKYEITELPVGTFVTPYKDFLETLDILSNVSNYTTDENTGIRIVIEFKDKPKEDDLIKQLKLSKSLSTNNMHLFNVECIPKRYCSPMEIIESYYTLRIELYEKRRLNIMNNLEIEIKLLSEKIRFIMGYLDKKITLYNKKLIEVEQQLESLKFDKKEGSFNYLVNLPLVSLTKEKLDKLNNELDDKNKLLSDTRGITSGQMWTRELDELYKLL